MRIGISVLTRATQNVWESGIGQNVLFLALSLKKIAFVKEVVLLDTGDQGKMPTGIDLDSMQLRLLKPEAAADEVDVLIEFGGAFNPSWLALQRARGKKVVYYCAGHPYAGVVETSVFDRPGYFFKTDRCDEVWSIPGHASLVSLQRVIHRCPVHVVPYVWSPLLLRWRIEEIARSGYHFGWKSDAGAGSEGEGLKVAMFEPNISVVKTSSISMLACDEAYRANSSSIAMMHVLNSAHMKDHPTMLHLANSLDLVKQHKACFHGRHDIAGFMAQHANAVISHQWTNDQNYSYMDALYGDYPLIHNSDWLNSFGAGYYYPGFEAAQGGRQLLNAWQNHNEKLPDQQRATRNLFAALEPAAETNVREYADLLRRLCHDAPALMEAV